jgi:hypothetical protein
MSMVKQRWLATHGRPMPVVIGVGRPDEAFGAHAWIEGYDHPSEAESFKELLRLAP